MSSTSWTPRFPVSLAVALVATLSGLPTGTVTGPSIAWAAAEATEDELNKLGVEARKRGDDLAALAFFQRAHRTYKTPRSSAQIGLAEVALGRWGDADVHLKEALASTSDPWIQKNEAILRETLARVQNEFGTLHILGSPDGAQLVIEGKVAGTLPLSKPVRVRKGECRFEVRAPNHVSVTRVVQIEPRSLRRETVELAPLTAGVGVVAPAQGAGASTGADDEGATARSPVGETTPSTNSAPADDADADGETSRLRPYAWATAVGAAAGLVFGAVQTVVALDKQNQFENHTGPNPADPTMLIKDCGTSMLSAQCKPIQEAHNRAVQLSIVGYAVGGALAVGSVVLFVLSSRPEPAARTALACVPDVHGRGISCQVRF